MSFSVPRNHKIFKRILAITYFVLRIFTCEIKMF